MPCYEYKIVPAPEKTRKVRGLKGADLFAHALEEVMNDLGADGWRYLRADTLPQEERSGLTSKTTTYRNLLIFQREIADGVEEAAPAAKPAAAPAPAARPVSEPVTADIDENLWTNTADEDEDEALPDPLFPHRQGQRVDL